MQPWSQPLLWKGVAGLPLASFISDGGTTTATSVATSMTVPLPATINAGDLLMSATTVGSARSPTWSAGWTPLSGAAIAYKIAAGGDAAPVVTFTSGAAQVGMVFRCGTTAHVGNTQANQAATGTSATCPAITTMTNNSRCWGIVLTGANSVVPSLPSGWISDDLATTVSPTSGFLLCHIDVASAGGSSGSITSTVISGPWRTGIIEGRTQ